MKSTQKKPGITFIDVNENERFPIMDRMNLAPKKICYDRSCQHVRHICFVNFILHLAACVLFAFNSECSFETKVKIIVPLWFANKMIEINDADTCTSAELKNLFDHSLRLSNEKAVSLKKDYLFHLDISW